MDTQSEDDAYRVQPPLRRGVLQRLRDDDLSHDCTAATADRKRAACTQDHVAIGQLSRTRLRRAILQSLVP
jgi:hypothetical protein